MRSLNVFVDDRLVGTLSEGNNLWLFDYDPAWVAWERSFDLSPVLARGTLRHEDGADDLPATRRFEQALQGYRYPIKKPLPTCAAGVFYEGPGVRRKPPELSSSSS